MRLRYSQWTEGSMTDEQRLESLVTLFSYLVVKTSGDVEQALEWLRQLAEKYGLTDENLSMEELIERLKEMGIIEEVNGVPELTTRGNQRIRQDALKQVFSNLKKGDVGNHEIPQTGQGIERTTESRPWEFGDSAANMDITATLSNAFARDIDHFSLLEDDLRMYETEYLASCATVVMVDISHSMILYGEDRITPAKQVALALAEFIKTKFPRDEFSLVTFGDDAQVVSIAELPFLQVGPFHTNTRVGLQLARNLLRKSGNANKQIFMITDGKPSAMFEPSGRLYKNSYGLDPRIINKTIDEAVHCRREKITISTFMIAQDPYLIDFVEEFTKANKGRAYYSSLNTLGQFLFVDYLKNRRKTV